MFFFYDACIIFLCDFIYFTRCRLRKKTWKNPGSIYLDNQVYEDDVPIFANWEVFLQILDGQLKGLQLFLPYLCQRLKRTFPLRFQCISYMNNHQFIPHNNMLCQLEIHVDRHVNLEKIASIKLKTFEQTKIFQVNDIIKFEITKFFK